MEIHEPDNQQDHHVNTADDTPEEVINQTHEIAQTRGNEWELREESRGALCVTQFDFVPKYIMTKDLCTFCAVVWPINAFS